MLTNIIIARLMYLCPAEAPNIWVLWLNVQRSNCPPAGSHIAPHGGTRQTGRVGEEGVLYCSARLLSEPRAPGTCPDRCHYKRQTYERRYNATLVLQNHISDPSRYKNNRSWEMMTHLLSSKGCRAVRLEHTARFSLLRLLMIRGLLSKHSYRKAGARLTT